MARGHKRGAEELDVGSFLAEARKKARKELLASVNVDAERIDLGHLIRSCQYLISTNLEIWERCKSRSLKYEQNGGNVNMTRISFHEVVCNTVHEKVEVIARPLPEEKVFGPLPAISSALLDILPPKDSISFDSLNSCGEYFTKGVSSLCDDMLGPFLLHLERHLKHVQVFLGDIESWIMGPRCNAVFLSELFEKEIKVPVIESCCRRPCTRLHSPSSICERCSKPFSEHRPDNGDGFFCHYCPIGGSFGCFSEDNECEPIVLLEHPHAQGSLNSSYNLDLDDDRRKLQKLKDYILC